MLLSVPLQLFTFTFYALVRALFESELIVMPSGLLTILCCAAITNIKYVYVLCMYVCLFVKYEILKC